MANETVACECNYNSSSVNKAKKYQVVLFPFNNAATNCYLTLMTFITYYGGYYLSGSFVGGVIAAAGMVALTVTLSTVVMLMRIFDGITDPVVGTMIDKTSGKLGKFRPFMIMGNLIMAVAIALMFFAIRPVNIVWLRWALFIVCYIIYVLGYTCQCACTKAGQTCITNDPHQRSQFVIWNMLGMVGSIVFINLIGSGLLPMIIKPIGDGLGAQYNPMFYNILVPITIGLSAIYTGLACIAIWKKDRPEFWGIDKNCKRAKFRDFVSLLKGNSQIRWLVMSAGFNKLASTISTSAAVAILIYGLMMGDYNGLFMPMYALSFVFMGIFFIMGSRTAGAKGQKRAIVQYTAIAFIFYIGLTIMLSMWSPGNAATTLTIFSMENGFHITINPFTFIWILLFGCGYGAYNCCSEMCIPMVADCTDYETYRSGNYVPGVMGTIFSLIDKVVSSLSTLLITVFTVNLIPGLGGKLPATGIVINDFSGVKLSALICFCVLPMVSWLITLVCMRFYKLNGAKLREIQAVNAVRKTAMAGGMPKEEAMTTWKTINQVPAEFVHELKVRKNKKTGLPLAAPKENLMDKFYKAIWGRNEKVVATPSVNAVQIPEKYRIYNQE